MKTLFLLPIFFLAALFQSAFFLKVEIFSLSLTFYLVISFILIIVLKSKRLSASIAAGLILDIFSFAPLGVFTFTIVFTSLLTGFLADIFKKRNFFTVPLLFICFFFFYNFFFKLTQIIF